MQEKIRKIYSARVSMRCSKIWCWRDKRTFCCNRTVIDIISKKKLWIKEKKNFTIHSNYFFSQVTGGPFRTAPFHHKIDQVAATGIHKMESCIPELEMVSWNPPNKHKSRYVKLVSSSFNIWKVDLFCWFSVDPITALK